MNAGTQDDDSMHKLNDINEIMCNISTMLSDKEIIDINLYISNL